MDKTASNLCCVKSLFCKMVTLGQCDVEMWVVGRDFLLDGDHNDLLGKFELIGHFNVDILVQCMAEIRDDRRLFRGSRSWHQELTCRGGCELDAVGNSNQG